MKKFSKVRLLQSIGFLDRKLNSETLRLERSLPLALYCYLCLALKLTHSTRLTLSVFWRREEPAQLFIGSIFNYLEDEPRFWMALVVSGWRFSSVAISNLFESPRDSCAFRGRLRRSSLSFISMRKTNIDHTIGG